MANSSIMDTFFQRSLEDLIKGIRLQASDSSTGASSFFSKSMEEIRKEIKSTDQHTKSTALLKLNYLHSLYGFDMSWADFHVIEVLSYPQFSLKKIGYLAASLSFHEGTEVLLLATNQFRKDLSSPNDFEVSLALNCFSVIATPDLSRDLCNDIFTLLSSTRIYVKKKAISVILRLFSKYPDAVRVCFKRLVENLESSDMQVLSAAVGVFCELTLRDPRAYLPLAPEFYRILIDCKNNWVLIKVLKMFAKLAQLEPRLAKKIVEPICDMMRRTMAKSLVYECVRTVIESLSDYDSAVNLAVGKIKEFLTDEDPNLKYLGLQALSGLSSKHLGALLDNKEIVIKSLSDADPNIKLASLRLAMSMVCEDNVVAFSKVLVNYALKSDPEFCNEIIGSILATCCKNYYEIVVDFDWYVTLLGEMSRIPHCQRGEEIESQLIDIGMRVKDVRVELVRVGRDLLIDPALLGNPFLHRILSAAAWVSGEYVEFSKNPFELMEALLQPRTNLLPPSYRAIYILSAFKVLVFCLQSYYFQLEGSASAPPFEVEAEVYESNPSQLLADQRAGDEMPEVSRKVVDSDPRSFEDGDEATTSGHSVVLSLSQRKTFTHESIVNLLKVTEMALRPLVQSHDVEILDRARNVLGLIALVKEVGSSSLHEGKRIIEYVYSSFSEELGPVSTSAQARVPVPDGLDLKNDLSELDMIYGDIQLPMSTSFLLGPSHSREREDVSPVYGVAEEDSQSSSEHTSLLTQHRKKHGLYYLPSEKDAVSDDYPPANDSNASVIPSHDVHDLVKLTEQSLILKKKSNHAKTRPVVVKLDDFDAPFALQKPNLKDDLVSGAVRDFLSGNEIHASSSQDNPSAEQLSKRKGKEKRSSHVVDARESSTNAVDAEHGHSSNRKSKHKSQGKERRHRSRTIRDERDENGHQDKQKSRHHHQSKHRVQGQTNAALHTPVIPDFLL
ncbi:hypothetical protein V2J09_014874 [Rumex salicifolius]